MSWITVKNHAGVMKINPDQIVRYYDTSPKVYGNGTREFTSVAIETTNRDRPFYLPISAHDLSNYIYEARKYGHSEITLPEGVLS